MSGPVKIRDLDECQRDIFVWHGAPFESPDSVDEALWSLSDVNFHFRDDRNVRVGRLRVSKQPRVFSPQVPKFQNWPMFQQNILPTRIGSHQLLH